jgi:hypothetical protein
MLSKIIRRILNPLFISINEQESKLNSLVKEINSIRNNVGKLSSKMDQGGFEIIKNIQEYEFQVYSQWGDDGIIQFLIRYLDIDDKRFVEFGVENYKECNTRFLLVNNNWTGLVMDGSAMNVKQIKDEEIYWKYNLTACSEFVTAENINGLLSKNGFAGDLGLLHIDIDGNDYWVWKAIEVSKPIIVIVEYNSVFGFDNPWTIPYTQDFVRTTFHQSNLYFGASILSLCDLAKEKGYIFIGCNSNGNNAYFIREDKKKDLREKSCSDGYVLSKFSESRSETGQLTFIRGDKRLEVIKGLPVFNTRKNVIENI